MTRAQEKIIGFCEAIREKANQADAADIAGLTTTLEAEVKGRRLLVPVVGAFSAGKSAILNSVLGRDLLPENIAPETAIATELCYSENRQGIEAVKGNGDFDTYEKIGDIKGKENRYQYLRFFLDNTNLQDIEPLVMVDMPGFESPKDEHNKAIKNYLDKGRHFVVLLNALDGTITRTELNTLKDIQAVCNGFSFFMSRSNQREPEKDNLLAEFKKVIKEELGINAEVIPLDQHSGIKVVEALKSVSADRIFLDEYQETLTAICETFIETLNKHIASYNIVGSSEEILEVMNNATDSFREKSDLVADTIRERCSSDLIAELVENDVNMALNAALNDLIPSALKKDIAGTTQTLTSIVNRTLKQSLQKKTVNLKKRITQEFELPLGILNEKMKDYNIDENYAESLVAIIETQQKSNAFEEFIGKIPTINIDEGRTQTVLTTTAILVAVINPIMGLIAFALPKVLIPFADYLTQGKKQKEMEEKFQKEIFPAVTATLKKEISQYLNDMIAQLILQVRGQFEQNINRQRDTIRKAMEEQAANAAESQGKREALEDLRNKVAVIKKEILEYSV
jgi:hypothetical protein